MKIIQPFLSFIFIVTFTFLSYGQENKKLDPQELTDMQLESLNKDVTLDDFQRLELRDFLLEGMEKIKTASESGMDSYNLRFLIENNNREFDNKLKEVLLPEQFETYMKLKRERAAQNDGMRKKDKKRKDKK